MVDMGGGDRDEGTHGTGLRQAIRVCVAKMGMGLDRVWVVAPAKGPMADCV